MSLPTTRRIVTGHDSTGKSIIESDITLTPANPLDATGASPTGIIPGFTNIFRTAGFPAANVQGPWTDVHGKKIGLVDQAGVYCRIVDFPATGPETKDDVNIMHRTQSVDFGVVLKGTITLILDDGSETVMKEGDVCVQRGTNHSLTTYILPHPIFYGSHLIIIIIIIIIIIMTTPPSHPYFYDSDHHNAQNRSISKFSPSPLF
ncbi:uncharacterized protein A1O5_01090 [Cladophialophora psammophila CBS 110553]|uniref:Cupin 2 conserved barrel domain-containing protein n=1 Tax=Cladophialophora psammophila CBS 110553 TaxID=1182543 RepID=W9X7X7_9EURO|nr:uncharacterized protein A1O5_01090 [Cladophialophora psammophila CBS 110553]EXJ76582.1 hypothetical protein A1O5_01090 [Cladophialophora psammophila CBS 110553]